MCHSERSAPVSGGDGTTFDEIVIPGEGTGIPGYLARPARDDAPAILIFHDINGPNLYYQDVARRLANEGFGALLPDFFVRQGPPADSSREAVMARGALLDEAATLADLALAFEWMTENLSARIAIVGFCLGGTLALLAAGRSPLPRASVAYYGFPAGRRGWSHVPTNEVDQLAAPLLAFWGDQDAPVGMETVAAWTAATEAAGREVEAIIYPGLPHGFLTFDPFAPHFDAAQDSWNRTLGFLRDHLQS